MALCRFQLPHSTRQTRTDTRRKYSRLPWSIQTRRSLYYVAHVALTVRLFTPLLKK